MVATIRISDPSIRRNVLTPWNISSNAQITIATNDTRLAILCRVSSASFETITATNQTVSTALGRCQTTVFPLLFLNKSPKNFLLLVIV